MFINEIYENILIEKNGKLTNAHAEVCKQKLGPGFFPPFLKQIEKSNNHIGPGKQKLNLVFYTSSLKQVENGYQLFRKSHPEYAEDSFRRYCFVRVSKGGVNAQAAKSLFSYLNWDLKTEYLSIGR